MQKKEIYIQINKKCLCTKTSYYIKRLQQNKLELIKETICKLETKRY